MIYLIMPILHLLTGIPIVNYDKLYLIPLFFEEFIAQILLSKRILEKEIPKGYLDFFYTGNIYNTVMAPHLTYSVLKHFFFSDIKFSVTNKKMTQKKGSFSFKYVWCSLLLFILSIVSIYIGAVNVFKVNFPLQSFLINAFWLLYNIPGLLTAIQIGYQRPRPRQADRVPIEPNTGVRILINDNEVIGKIKDISTKGVKIELPNRVIEKLNSTNKYQIVVGKTKIEILFNEVRNENEVIFRFLDEMDFNKKIMVIRVFLKFLKPYKDNYNVSLD